VFGATGALLTLTLADPTAGAGVDFCRKTSEAARNSCRAGARSDFELALGKCDNLTDPVERRACEQEADAELKRALETCDVQFGVRQAICTRLGGASYDPLIDPKNFVNKIDNPYFPLKPGTTFTYSSQTEAGVERNVFSVTHNTRVILGVACVGRLSHRRLRDRNSASFGVAKAGKQALERASARSNTASACTEPFLHRDHFAFAT